MTSNDQTRVLSPIHTGETFAGRYEILSELGSGGMGAVYKAKDTLANEVVALKVMHPNLARNAGLARQFTRELSSARKLAHPNVVRIHDIGDSDGALFLSMEYVDGRTIAAILAAEGRFTFEAFRPLFFQICDALACVHAAKLVHRDIKPLNVMIDRSGTAKLMDFGIAGDLEDGGTAVIGGTPAYMAPELARGEDAGPAVDIYSAGVMFFEMLTGAKPGPKPSWNGAADVPGEFREIVNRAMRQDPHERYTSVTEIAAAARKLSAGGQGSTPAPPPDGTLAGHLLDGPAAIDSVLPVFSAVLDAFAALLAAGTPHQCPSPDRIRFAGGSAMVESGGAASGGTVVVANAKYAAPELFADGGGANARAVDAYVLGFIFYEILLGRRLFGQATGGVADDVGWLRWHAAADQAARPVSELLPEIPRAVSEAIAGMMAKRPETRLQDCAEIARKLHGVAVEVEQTVLRTGVKRMTGTIERRGKKRTSFKVLFIGAGILAGCAAGVGGWLAWPSNVPSPDPPAPPSAPVLPPPVPRLPELVDTSTGPMVLVPAGEFVMGNDHGRQSEEFGYFNEAPAHKASVDAFYIDKFEVTNAQYRRFCDATDRTYPRQLEADPQYFDRADRPVINVSWDDAQAFAAWAKKRLPTEAEWEKAARGEDGRRFPWGNDYVAPAVRAEGGLIGPVGSVPHDRSPYGVMDLAGNAAEWVADAYRLYAGNTAFVSSSEEGHKVVRGVWFDQDPRVASITNRGSGDPLQLHGESYIGFRCAMDIQTAKTNGGIQ